MPWSRISDSDLIAKINRKIRYSEPEKVAYLLEQLLGVSGAHEGGVWTISPIDGKYNGGFNIKPGGDPIQMDAFDLRTKLFLFILHAKPKLVSLLAADLLGVQAEWDHLEYYPWKISPIKGKYDGDFDIEFHEPKCGPQPKGSSECTTSC